MLTVPKVNFEVVDGHSRSGSVQFTRTVVTADPRQVLVFQLMARRAGGVSHREHGFGIDGRISHDSFEGVVRVGPL